MISVETTPHMVGLRVSGDYDELNALYDAIWEVVGPGYDEDPSVSQSDAIMRERLLALCYDLRHAYMGSRGFKLVDNGLDEESARWLGVPDGEATGKNLVYSVEVLYPEAMYEVLVLNELLEYRGAKVLGKKHVSGSDVDDPRVLMDVTTAWIRLYQGLVMQAIQSSTSKAMYGRIRNQVRGAGIMSRMYPQWVDVINCDWLYMTDVQRKKGIGTVVRDLASYARNLQYRSLVEEINEFAREHDVSRVNVRVCEYPDYDESTW